MQKQYQDLTAKIFYTITLFLCMNFAVAGDTSTEESFRVGYYLGALPDISNEDLEISLKLLADEIGKQAGINTQVTIFNDLALMRNEFEQGKINFVTASSLDINKYFDAELFANGFKINTINESSETIIVMTRKNEGLDNFKNLRGKSLSLVEFNPISELYVDYLSRTNFKKNYKEAFNKIIKEKKSQQAILKLFFGQTDVICIYQNALKIATELNPQLETKLQVIAKITSMPQAIGLFHKNTPASFAEKVIADASELDKYPRGRQLLQLFKADKLVPAKLDDLSAVKQLYDDYLKAAAGKH